MQTYLNGDEVRLGDVVRWPSDEGKIVALEGDLPKWGLGKQDATGKAMIKFEKAGLVCETTASEDLQLIKRGEAAQ